ncbi:general substrate transporter [Coniophora puteana RWD-64-598 SS2]|uniref:General substrate transporter n=1 Tax=Coniophora puteana (strain RWD-64-598) TaxID=741705 RepID=A0A5M3N1T5_CONPW|nr:general substrate transporter [Coniophora puteana RWD-64-598 SS2]EIW85349.1 general substrate transporter [Coniophora puteana RWD-64-598 SS2]
MAPEHTHQTFTTYGWAVCVWVLVVSFQYGYHISALNQIQAVLTCQNVNDTSPLYHGLPVCVPMSDTTFSVVTSIFTIGGLVGSLSANIATNRLGRKGACQVSALSTSFGAALSGVAASVSSLAFGRFFVGLGAGLGLCIGPIYLAEIAPSKIKGNLGKRNYANARVLTQLAIVVGIMVTQSVGVAWATPRQWRLVLLLSSAISLTQLVTSPFIIESPVYLLQTGKLDRQKVAMNKIWSGKTPLRPDPEESASEEPLLGDEDRSQPREDVFSVSRLLFSHEYRKPMLIIISAMLCQQLSGINAVLYYSNSILAKALPDLAAFVSLGITVVNFLMTFPPIFLINRFGRKKLMQLSIFCAIVSHVLVGYGLDGARNTLASVAIITFVMSFAVGLGPIPFVMIPEVSPSHVSSAISSVALSLNWVSNFIIGLVFLPLRNSLSSGDPLKEGRVFYIFAAVLCVCAIVFSRLYRG